MRKPSRTRKPQLVRSESKEKLGGILNPAFNKPLIKEASKSERQLGELLEVFEPQISKKKSNSELIATTPDTKKAEHDLEVRRGSAVTDVQTVSSPKTKTVEFLCVFEGRENEEQRVCWLNQVEPMEPADWIGHILGVIKEDGGVPQCSKCGLEPALAVFMNCTHGGLCPACAQAHALSERYCYFCSKVASTHGRKLISFSKSRVLTTKMSTS